MRRAQISGDNIFTERVIRVRAALAGKENSRGNWNKGLAEMFRDMERAELPRCTVAEVAGRNEALNF